MRWTRVLGLAVVITAALLTVRAELDKTGALILDKASWVLVAFSWWGIVSACWRSWRRRLCAYYEAQVERELAAARATDSVSSVAPAPPASPHSIRVRLLSYNVFIRPPGVTSHGNDYKDERLGRILAQLILRNADVVALQELFALGAPRRAAFLATAANLGGYRYSTSLPYPPPLLCWPPKVVDGGVTILSRHPIVASHHTTYRSAHWRYIDVLTAKGVLHARIALPAPLNTAQSGGRLEVDVFATHAQAGDIRYRGIAGVRRRQIHQLATFLHRHGSATRPLIVCGDLNVNGRRSATDSSDSEEYREMMQMLRQSPREGSADATRPPLRDLLREEHHGSHPITVGDVDADGRPVEHSLAGAKDRACRKRLDYVLVREAVSIPLSASRTRVMPFRVQPPEKTPFEQLSDHYALESILDWRVNG